MKAFPRNLRPTSITVDRDDGNGCRIEMAFPGSRRVWGAVRSVARDIGRERYSTWYDGDHEHIFDGLKVSYVESLDGPEKSLSIISMRTWPDRVGDLKKMLGRFGISTLGLHDFDKLIMESGKTVDSGLGSL